MPSTRDQHEREVVREPAVLLAHSFGAAVAVQVAAETPQAVRAVVLEDPGFFVRPLATLAGGRYHAAFAQARELLLAGRSREEVLAALDAGGRDAAALRVLRSSDLPGA